MWLFSPKTSRLEYRPLRADISEIRLLYLEPGRHTDRVRCKLVHTTVGSGISYSALSYAWGDEVASQTIEIDSTLYIVRRGLLSALRRIRSTTDPVVLWVDALCINQHDIAERNAQVRRMRDIYGMAEQVILWLGEDDFAQTDITAASALLEDLEKMYNSLLEQELYHSQTHRASESIKQLTIKRCVSRTVCSGDYMARWGPLYRIMSSDVPYWTRLWTVQERLVASLIMIRCGPLIVEASFLALIMREFESVVREGSPGRLQHLNNWKQRASGLKLNAKSFLESEDDRRTYKAGSLIDLLIKHSGCHCEDPRDYVYGLIGISDMASSNCQGVLIDYAKPVSEVFTGAAREIIANYGNLEILMACSSPSPWNDLLPPISKDFRKPSWVPDWRRHEAYISVLGKQYRFAKGRIQAARISSDNSTLYAQGFCVGSVQSVSPDMSPYLQKRKGLDHSDSPSYLLNYELLQSWRSWLLEPSLGSIINQKASRKITKAQVVKQFYLTILEPFQKEADLFAIERQWEEWDVRENSSLMKLGLTTFDLPNLDFLKSGWLTSRFRLFISSIPRSSGELILIGMCPLDVKGGDLVCCIFGCSLPVFLRRVQKHYIVIRCRTLTGYRDGKAIDDLEQGVFTMDEFEIR